MSAAELLWWFATAPFVAMGALAAQLFGGLAVVTVLCWGTGRLLSRGARS